LNGRWMSVSTGGTGISCLASWKSWSSGTLRGVLRGSKKALSRGRHPESAFLVRPVWALSLGFKSRMAKVVVAIAYGKGVHCEVESKEAGGDQLDKEWHFHLEDLIKKSPFSYKIIGGNAIPSCGRFNEYSFLCKSEMCIVIYGHNWPP
jgi:hypothetical protein